jgi:hypothetical protein
MAKLTFIYWPAGCTFIALQSCARTARKFGLLTCEYSMHGTESCPLLSRRRALKFGLEGWTGIRRLRHDRQTRPITQVFYEPGA